MSDHVFAEMNTSRLALRSPDALIAALPHMLGFEPRDSVVLVGVNHPESGGARVAIVGRVDDPSLHMPVTDLPAIARTIVGSFARSDVDAAMITVFGSTTPTSGEDLPSQALVDELVAALDDRGIHASELHYTDGVSHWSYGCTDPSCCPPHGQVISPDVRTHLAAEFALHGVATATSRDALVDELTPVDPATAPQAAAIHAAAVASLQARPPDQPERDAWRDRALAHVIRVLAGDRTPDAVGAAIAGLCDIRVRDTVLWDLAQLPGSPHRQIDALRHMVTHAPAGQIAPVATALAVTQWTVGDGTRANVALARAFADQPEYNLALLVEASVRTGMPPHAWRDIITGLTRETCRYGVDQIDRPAAAPATAPAISPATPAATASAPVRPRRSPTCAPTVSAPADPAPGIAI